MIAEQPDICENFTAEIEREMRTDGSSENYSEPLTSYSKPILESDALCGLAGDIVRAIDPFTEGDAVAVLTNSLTAFGNVVGPTPYFLVESTAHHMNLFVAQVGNTSKGRKGTAWSTPKKIFSDVDSEWAANRITGGLSSGEGLVYAVRDAKTEKMPIKEAGRVVDYQKVITDEGVDDKRLLVVEEEFSQALKVMARDGNILSATVRQAWDVGDLHPLTKNNPLRATGAHISIIGHITKSELLRYLTATEQANGFANRFCWFVVARSKFIPNPRAISEKILLPLVEKVRDAVAFARRVGEMRRDKNAEAVWADIYPDLSREQPGLVGAIIARGEAQVMRLACIYALLNQSEVVRSEHLRAALALWDYSEESAFAIFGELTGDPAVDKVKQALETRQALTMTELSNLFARNVTKSELDRIVSVVLKEKFATIETEKDGRGRPGMILRRARK
jgi:hypothetical protein